MDLNRKLNRYQADKIREAYDKGASQNQLANLYGVCKGTIKNIVQNKTYKEAKPKIKTNALL